MANEQTFVRLTEMAVAESQMGNADGAITRRFKIIGILRDALRQKSVGIIEEIPEKGIVKYAKPVGVIAGLLPVTNPVVTMVAMTINAVKCRDALIFRLQPFSAPTVPPRPGIRSSSPRPSRPKGPSRSLSIRVSANIAREMKSGVIVTPPSGLPRRSIAMSFFPDQPGDSFSDD